MDKYSEKQKGKLERKGIRLFAGDAAIIDEHFPRAGHNIIIRKLVHNFVKKLVENNNKEFLNADITITLEGSGEGESS